MAIHAKPTDLQSRSDKNAQWFALSRHRTLCTLSASVRGRGLWPEARGWVGMAHSIALRRRQGRKRARTARAAAPLRIVLGSTGRPLRASPACSDGLVGSTFAGGAMPKYPE